MRAALRVALALIAVAAPASAQESATLRIRAARRDTITASTTVTAAFTVTNRTGDIVHVFPRVEAPANWPVLTGATSFAIAPNAAEVLMVSVVVPGRAAAGVYSVGVQVGVGVADSVVVRVPPRRAVDVALLDKPGYVISGRTYDARFLVRNRGNHHARLAVRAKSTLGRATITDTLLPLAPDESAVLEVRVTTPRGLSAATDDVVEVSVAQDSLTDVRIGSARVMIVPEPTRTIEEFLRIPTQVNLRAASSDAVSPFEVFGRGPVRDGGSTELEFLLRGPTGPFSAFGERDEYRASLTAPSWRVRAGDQVYMLSPLTGGAQPGVGASVDGTRGAVRGGVHAQQFRRSPGKGSEVGAFLGAEGSDVHGALHFVNRDGGLLPGQVASVSAGWAGAPLLIDGELAHSTDVSGRSGIARSIRISRADGDFSIDVGHHHADTVFSGAQRGAENSFLTATANRWETISLALSAGSHRTDLTRATGIPYVERFDIGTLGATWLGRYTVELGGAARATTVAGLRQRGTQGGVRVRADQALVFGHLSLTAEMGRASGAQLQPGTFTDFGVSMRRALGHGSVSLWTERYSGGSITKGTQGTLTFGGDGTLRILNSTDLSILGYATRVRAPGAPLQSQVDVLASRQLANGSRVNLRARLIGGSSLAHHQENVAYLEYAMPLRLPVSRLRTPGRVYGRVVDAVSGRGVPGALVRLGPQVAITDRDGEVAFGGVPGGEHRLSMSQETSFADAVFVGDPNVHVDSTRPQPTTFQLTIARSARVDITARRFAAVRMGVGGAPDSLSDAGPLANATLVLAGERDTLYRTTREDGSAAFTDVPPGRWAVFIRGDAPAFHRFDPDRLELILEPGESRALSFRLVPRKREVQLIGDGEELRSEPVQQGTQARPQPAAPRTRKPQENPQE